MPFIKDAECTVDTPVILGARDAKIYGQGKVITPNVPGRSEQINYLPALLPLEDYDLVIILFSGGKDSVAAYLKLREMGVPAEKMELWHHDIDGGHPTRRMDWRVTANYVKSFAQATGIKLRLSWRINGFWGELYRVGASLPVQYEGREGIKTCKLSKKQLRSAELRRTMEDPDELKGYGYRMKFPAKSGDLNARWCSAYLKIAVGDSVIANLEELKSLGSNRHKFPAKGSPQSGRWCSGALKASVQDGVTVDMEATKYDCKLLVVSGERRGESAGRAKYNEMELDRTNAQAKAKRLVHHWRAVIDYSERDIWEVLKRNNVNPHPCYRAGWNRCSCMMCIFSSPSHWAGIKELEPESFQEVRQDEKKLGFTLDNKKNLDEFIEGATSCVYHGDESALRQLKTGVFDSEDVFVVPGTWQYPAGAFHGSEGGPC